MYEYWHSKIRFIKKCIKKKLGMCYVVYALLYRIIQCSAVVSVDQWQVDVVKQLPRDLTLVTPVPM